MVGSSSFDGDGDPFLWVVKRTQLPFLGYCHRKEEHLFPNKWTSHNKEPKILFCDSNGDQCWIRLENTAITFTGTFIPAVLRCFIMTSENCTDSFEMMTT